MENEMKRYHVTQKASELDDFNMFVSMVVANIHSSYFWKIRPCYMNGFNLEKLNYGKYDCSKFVLYFLDLDEGKGLRMFFNYFIVPCHNFKVSV